MKLGKTYHERLSLEKKRNAKRQEYLKDNWKKVTRWFAWYPVKTDYDRYVWLETVNRRRGDIYLTFDTYTINCSKPKYYYYEI